MRWPIALLAAMFVLAPSGFAAPGPPPFPVLPGGWSHAEINVRIGKQPHTLILDHGRIVVATAKRIVIREPDTSLVTIPIAVTSRVTVDGIPSTIFSLRRRMKVATMRIDGGVAVRVRAQS